MSKYMNRYVKIIDLWDSIPCDDIECEDCSYYDNEQIKINKRCKIMNWLENLPTYNMVMVTDWKRDEAE